MTRGRKYLDDKEDFYHIEKIRKTKRSVRGRTIDDWLVDEVPKDMMLGRVIEVHKRHAFVAEESENGIETDQIWFCSIAKRHFQRSQHERNFVVVGDKIAFVPDRDVKTNDSGEIESDLPRGVIQHCLNRTNKISRNDPLNPEWEHVLFANIDRVVIVASVLKPAVSFGLIDRLLVCAEVDQIPAVIVLNKIDLLKDMMKDKESLNHFDRSFIERYEKYCEIYRGLGYEVLEISALYPKRTASEIKKLRTMIKGNLIGFLGHSGVGKSSIVNLMKPEFEQIVDENPEIFYKGRHTTTYNSLLSLGIGAFAIDSPGVRAFDVDSYDIQTIASCFREFRHYKCKYRSCMHYQETDCAIKDAVEKGEISVERYKSYLSIVKGKK